MYELTRLEYIEKNQIFDSVEENILIELYIDYRTNNKYILNKIRWQDYAYIKEYNGESLKDDIFIMPYGFEDKEIYGKNPLSIGSSRIDSEPYKENYLTENDICKIL